MKTAKLIAFADNMRDKIMFEVPSNWLDKTLENWAMSDAIDVYENVESYIKVRKEQLYDNLDDKADMLLNFAIEDEIIINSEVIKVS